MACHRAGDASLRERPGAIEARAWYSTGYKTIADCNQASATSKAMSRHHHVLAFQRSTHLEKLQPGYGKDAHHGVGKGVGQNMLDL